MLRKPGTQAVCVCLKLLAPSLPLGVLDPTSTGTVKSWQPGVSVGGRLPGLGVWRAVPEGWPKGGLQDSNLLRNE